MDASNAASEGVPLALDSVTDDQLLALAQDACQVAASTGRERVSEWAAEGVAETMRAGAPSAVHAFVAQQF